MRRLLRRRLAGGVLVPVLEAATRFKTARGDPPWFRWAILTGRYERRTRQLISDVIRPGAVAFDVGAHVGYHTVFLADKIGPRGKVVAFEPHPEHLELLRGNVAGFPNVAIVAAAVSDRNGQGILYDYKIESGSSSLYAGQEDRMLPDLADRGRATTPRRTRRFPVRTIRLDSFVAAQATSRPDFVKLDVEGAEIPALEGIASVVQGHSLSLLLELNPETLHRSGRTSSDLMRLLQDLGFRSARAIDDLGETDWPVTLGQAERLADVIARNGHHLNLLCVK